MKWLLHLIKPIVTDEFAIYSLESPTRAQTIQKYTGVNEKIFTPDFAYN